MKATLPDVIILVNFALPMAALIAETARDLCASFKRTTKSREPEPVRSTTPNANASSCGLKL